MGQKDVDAFVRLYMAPGMQHCGGGPGPNVLGAGPNSSAGEFTIFSVMEKWVESGKAPEKIVATKFKTDGNASSGVARTRPLCAYPQVARYSGSGSSDDAANFSCVAPK
jgi:feruloyl esterase